MIGSVIDFKAMPKKLDDNLQINWKEPMQSKYGAPTINLHSTTKKFIRTIMY